MLTFHTKSINDMELVAQSIISKINFTLLCFYGNLGSGKTTLIKEILKKLKVNDPINSPSFSIVNKYNTLDSKIIYHFDFYRINSVNEAYDIGIEEYLDSNNLCFIEWPEKIESLLPMNFHKISIFNEMNNRTITFEE